MPVQNKTNLGCRHALHAGWRDALILALGASRDGFGGLPQTATGPSWPEMAGSAFANPEGWPPAEETTPGGSSGHDGLQTVVGFESPFAAAAPQPASGAHEVGAALSEDRPFILSAVYREQSGVQARLQIRARAPSDTCATLPRRLQDCAAGCGAGGRGPSPPLSRQHSGLSEALQRQPSPPAGPAGKLSIRTTKLSVPGRGVGRLQRARSPNFPPRPGSAAAQHVEPNRLGSGEAPATWSPTQSSGSPSPLSTPPRSPPMQIPPKSR